MAGTEEKNKSKARLVKINCNTDFFYVTIIPHSNQSPLNANVEHERVALECSKILRGVVMKFGIKLRKNGRQKCFEF